MAFQYLNNRPLDEARNQYLALLQEEGFAPRTETIPVPAAGGRITAGAVYARICAPHYPACAMDGIAVIVNQANPITGLTSAQIQQIYLGEVTTWADVQ